jgi:hypothetical protein
MRKLNFFWSITICLVQLGCSGNVKNEQSIDVNNDIKSDETQTKDILYNDCNGMPKCDEKEGLKVVWSPGVTSSIVKREEFLKQIPEGYNGYLKLCGENGLYRYISCKNGKVEGVSYDFDCDGGYDEQYYKNSIAEGTWIHYNKSGQYDFVRNFKNGELHGEFKSFHDNLELFKEENYVDGKLHGTSITYFLSGEIEKLEKYNHGIMTSSKSFHENGQVDTEQEFERGIIKKWISYDQFGNKIFEMKNRPSIKIHRP